MNRMMNIRKKYSNNQNWNIGFSQCTPEEFIEKKSLGRVVWMKHHYRDRFFADPFIWKVTDEAIFVFVEECEFEHPKGRLVELVVDAVTKELKERYVLLELDTHLSYPFILREDENVWVCPENGASGSWKSYLFDSKSHSLVNPQTIVQEGLTDASLCIENNQYWVMATKVPFTQQDAFLYHSSKERDLIYA